MGIDVRMFLDDRLEDVVTALRSEGFNVRVTENQTQDPQDAHAGTCGGFDDQGPKDYFITVSKGHETITLAYGPEEPEIGGYYVYIPNLWALTPGKRLARQDFQTEVTEVLESLGAHFPIQETAD